VRRSNQCRQVWELPLLRVKISNLRRKIESHLSRPHYLITESEYVI